MSIATAAGIAAEAIDAGTTITDALRTGPGKGDYEILERGVGVIISSGMNRPAESLIAEWEERATELLKANWAWVEEVASSFVDQEGKLSGDDVRSCRPEVIPSYQDEHVYHGGTEVLAC